jgi:hypothetical protein
MIEENEIEWSIRVVQVVEHLPSKSEVLSSDPSIGKRERKKR